MDILTLATYAVIAFTVVMIVRAVVRALRWERQEREGAGQWATENGWGFVPSDHSLVQQWQTYPIRGEGAATQVLTTTLAGQHVSPFWYQESGGFGGRKAQHMIAVRLEARVPTVIVVPAAHAMRFPKLTPVPQPDESFNMSWTVLAEGEITAAVRTAITPEFRQTLSSARFAADVHSLVLFDRFLLVTFRSPRDLTTLVEQVDSVGGLA